MRKGVFLDNAVDVSFGVAANKCFVGAGLEAKFYSGAVRQSLNSTVFNELRDNVFSSNVLVIRFYGENAYDHWVTEELNHLNSTDRKIILFGDSIPSHVLRRFSELVRNEMRKIVSLDDFEATLRAELDS